MNVKNKVISVVMSFIIIFGTVSSSFANDKEHINNIQPLVVDGGIISAPMLATVATLAVATGVAINNDYDLYSIGRMFYEQNKAQWDFIKTTFASAVYFNQATKQVFIKKDFLDIFKNTFSNVNSLNIEGHYGLIPILESTPTANIDSFNKGMVLPTTPNIYYNGDLRIEIVEGSFSDIYFGSKVIGSMTNAHLNQRSLFIVGRTLYNVCHLVANGRYSIEKIGSLPSDFPLTFPGYGGYKEDTFEGKDEIGVYVPSNLGDLKGLGSNDVLNNPTYEGSSNPTLPGVNNPSIDVDTSTSFPIVGDTSTDVPGTDVPGIDKPGIVFPPFGGGLDFTPITQSSFVDKFPFSLAKDIKNIVSVFDVEPKAPKFTVPIVSEELEIDLTQFNVWAGIIRFFVLIGFMIALINITRKVIG